MSTDAPQDDSVSSILEDMTTQHLASQDNQPAPDQTAQSTQPAEPQPAGQLAADAQTDQQPGGQDVQPDARHQQPEPDPAEEPVIPTPESRLAPLFQLGGLPQAEAMPQAISLVREIAEYDPIHYGLLANAVLRISQPAIQNAVLKNLGVSSEKVTEFSDWIKNGGGKLPEPVEYPAFEQTIQKLQSAPGDAETDQWVRLANGVELNLSDPRDNTYYQMEKRLYESGVKEKADERARAERAQQEAAEQKQQEQAQAQQDLMDRATFYESGRYAVADALVNKVVSTLGPDDKLRGDMLKAYVKNHIDTHPGILQLGRQAAAYVQEGHGFSKDATGQWQMSGRAKEFAEAQDRLIRAEVNSIIDQSNKDILRANRAELAATSTDPRIPETAEPITLSAPPPPNLEGAQTLQEILVIAEEQDRQQRAAQRQ